MKAVADHPAQLDYEPVISIRVFDLAEVTDVDV